MRWLEATELRERAALQARQSQEAAAKYQRITASFPVTQTSTENLRIAVVEFRRIAERSALPEDGFTHISQVLRDFPQMEVDALVWSAGRPGAGSSPRPAKPAPPAAAPVPGAKPAASDEAVQIELGGRVNATQRDDYRGITAQVQRFAQALGTAGFEVVATKLPFDITSEGTLTGNIGTDSTEAPRFTITLGRRLP